jgi:hypothetical protein
MLGPIMDEKKFSSFFPDQSSIRIDQSQLKLNRVLSHGSEKEKGTKRFAHAGSPKKKSPVLDSRALLVSFRATGFIRTPNASQVKRADLLQTQCRHSVRTGQSLEDLNEKAKR